jgi:Tfp pilus assembly protein PilF
MNSPIMRRSTIGLMAVAALSVVMSACGGGKPSPSASKKSPSTVNSTLSKAVHEMAQGHDALAVANFLAVIKTDRSNDVAWYDLGVIAQQQNQDTQAVDDYLSSLAGDAKYLPALYNLATLETSSHPETAVELYQKVIDIQPDNADAHLNLGFLLETLGQRQDGAEHLVRAIQLDPSLASRVPSSALSDG